MLEFFTSHYWLLWLALSFILLIAELSSGDLYMLCISIGALASMVACLVGAPLWVQIVVLVVAALLCITLIRPPLLKRLHAGGDEKPSNADALIGRKGRVIETITDGGFGYVKIDGDEWRSVSHNGITIPEGMEVEVISRESIVLTVKPIG